MKKNYLLIQSVLLLLFCGSIAAQPVSQTYSVAGTYTYTVPIPWGTVVTVECIGAGGGGGANSGNSRDGGGGGAYARTTGIILASGSYTVVVGAGGAGSANGGNSSFATTTVVAQGGNAATAGAPGTGGTTAGSTGTTKNAGGAGGNKEGTNSSGGGGGGSATSAAAGVAGGNGGAITPGVGGTGGTGSGTGGAGGNTNFGAGAPSGPGGGGGGKGATGSSSASGNGADGQVIITVSSLLAIQIANINVEKGPGYNTINWQANCSSSQAIFDVERSADGRTFTSVNTITASQQRCLQPFSYVDNTGTAGTLYYRIRITDLDGKITYSSIVKLTNSTKDMMLVGVAPNPVSNVAQLSVAVAKNDRVELQVISVEGRVVQRSTVAVQAGTSIVNLDVANLQNGMYTIKGVFANGETSTVKFMKQ